MDHSDDDTQYTVEELWVRLFGEVFKVSYKTGFDNLLSLMRKERFVHGKETRNREFKLHNLISVLMVGTPGEITRQSFVKYLNYFIHEKTFSRNSKKLILSMVAHLTTLVMKLDGFYLSYQTPIDLEVCYYVIRLGSDSAFVFVYKQEDEDDYEEKIKINVNLDLKNRFIVSDKIQDSDPKPLVSMILDDIQHKTKCALYNYFEIY